MISLNDYISTSYKLFGNDVVASVISDIANNKNINKNVDRLIDLGLLDKKEAPVMLFEAYLFIRIKRFILEEQKSLNIDGINFMFVRNIMIVKFIFLECILLT